MTLYYYIIALCLGASTIALTEADLWAIHADGHAKNEWVQTTNDEQLILAVTLEWQFDNNTTQVPTVEQLVAEGRIKANYLTRPMVKDQQVVLGATGATP